MPTQFINLCCYSFLWSYKKNANKIMKTESDLYFVPRNKICFVLFGRTLYLHTRRSIQNLHNHPRILLPFPSKIPLFQRLYKNIEMTVTQIPNIPLPERFFNKNAFSDGEFFKQDGVLFHSFEPFSMIEFEESMFDFKNGVRRYLLYLVL